MSLSRLVVCLAVGVAGAAAHAAPPARMDSDGAPLPPGAIARLGSQRFRHDRPPTVVALSADGRRAASASGAEVRLWDLPDGKPRGVLRGHVGTVVALAFSPDGRALASCAAGAAGEVRLWDVNRARFLRSMPVPLGLTGLTLESDGPRLAVVLPGLGIVVREIAGPKGQLLLDPTCRGSVAFGPGGTVLASSRADGDIVLWDLESGVKTSLLHGLDEPARDIAFSPDGARLAASDGDGFRVWQVATRKEVGRLEDRPILPGSLHFVAGGKALVAVAGGREVRRWDLASGKDVLLWEDERWDVATIALSRDGRRAVLSSRNGPSYLRQLDLARKREVPVPPGHDAYLSGLAFSRDGKLAATTCWLHGDPFARVWEARTGRLRYQLGKHRGGAGAVAFSPDGKLLATTARSEDRTIYLWNADNGRAVRRLVGHRGWVCSLAFSPDSSLLASGDAYEAPNGTSQGTARVWAAHSGEPLRALVGHGSLVRALAFTADSRSLVTVADRVRLIDLVPGKLRWQVDGQGVAALSPDGRLVASRLGPAGEIGVLEAMTGKPLFRVKAHPDQATALAFSPDGRVLASAGLGEGTIRLWEPIDGRPLGTLTGHGEGGVATLAFAGGRLLASGGMDATALVWEVPAVPARPARLKPEQAWADLGSAEPGRAFRAIQALAADQAGALPYLGNRLQPVSGQDDKQLARLVADLDADELATRDRAQAALGRIGLVAEEVLRAKLAGNASLEQRRRIDVLLKRIEDLRFSPDVLRPLRAVVVLERIDSEAARRVLLRLASGDRRAALSREAASTLRRLVRQAKRP